MVRLFTDISDVITVYALNVEVIKSSVPMVVVLPIIPSALVAIGYFGSELIKKARINICSELRTIIITSV